MKTAITNAYKVLLMDGAVLSALHTGSHLILIRLCEAIALTI